MQTEEFRQAISESFKVQIEKIVERFGAFGRKQLMWQPEFDKWSVGQVLYHIWLTNDRYLKLLGHTVRHSNVPVMPTVPYKSSWLGKRFIYAVGPRGFAGKVPKAFVPHYDAVPQDIVKQLQEQFEALEILVKDCKGKDLQQIKIPSPFVPFMRFQAGDALKAIEQHNERHIAQATRVIKLGRFPAMQPVVVTPVGVRQDAANAPKDGGSLY